MIDLRDEKEEFVGLDVESAEGIWILCEFNGGKIRNVSFELLAKGRELANTLNQELVAVLIGSQVESHVEELVHYGADKVIYVDEISLDTRNELLCADVLIKLCRKYNPLIILVGATTFGRSIAPRVAGALRTGLTADCTILDVDPEKKLLIQTRPAFGGNLMATIVCKDTVPQMATVRPKIFKFASPDIKRKGEIIRERMELDTDQGIKYLDTITTSADGARSINECDIIVAVGQGIGSINNIQVAEELADLLDAGLAVSRPLVDNVWYPYSHQVGQTGKTVTPDYYLAFGISGAVQHVAGVGAEKIIAVNSDPDAPIFRVADYAICGDCMEIMRSMIETIKKQKSAIE